ncbi:MAG: hypothetical protein OHK0013_16030 [Sandaracinaceae bacterium]
MVSSLVSLSVVGSVGAVAPPAGAAHGRPPVFVLARHALGVLTGSAPERFLASFFFGSAAFVPARSSW